MGYMEYMGYDSDMFHMKRNPLDVCTMYAYHAHGEVYRWCLPLFNSPPPGRQDARDDSAYKKFHVKHDDSRLYKNGVLGRFISCAPLPPLLTPHS